MKKRNKLYIVLLLFLIVFTLFLLNSIENKEEKELQILSEANLLVKELSINTLMLRRHEKDLLLRNEHKYIAKFNESYILMRENISRLNVDLKYEEIDVTLLSKFENELNIYASYFLNLVEKKLLFGLTEVDGKHYELRKNIHNLLSNIQSDKKLLASVLELRKLEKDFLSRKDLKYKKLFTEKIDFLLANSHDEKFKKQLLKYKKHFFELANIQEEIGLTENLGVMKKMRSSIHQGEDTLKELSTQFIKEIEQKSISLIRVTNISIIGLFIIIMIAITILIRFFMNESKINELKLLNDELSKTLQNLKLTQEKLVESEKMSSLGGLVAGVAHEINTPVGIGLTGMSHFLDMTQDVKKKYDDNIMTQDVFENYLTTSEELAIQINANLKKTAQLVTNFKKISFDQTSEEQRKINLKEYLDEILFSMKMILKKTNITVENRCDSEININTYPGAISQVITNLIINSIKHAFDEKQQGNITISAVHETNKITLLYEDNGKGIDKEILPKIFDPFFTTNRENGGTGLGLNILYNIVSSTLLGTITCDSKKESGIKFTIIFQENGANKSIAKDPSI